MRRLWFVSLLVLATLSLAALACGSSSPTATPAPKLEPVTLTGSGDDVIDIGHLAGYTKAKLTHDGKANFIVRPLDADGNERMSLVNEIGAYSGTVVWDKTGFTLSIKADGKWTITLSQ